MIVMKRSLLPGVLAVLLGASGCGGSSFANAGSDGGRLKVAAAFYPLEYLASRIGGDRVEVVGLTKPGAEPHDAELTARQLGAVTDADVVVYEAGLQGAVDESLSHARAGAALDVAPSARLDVASAEEPDGHAGEGDPAEEHAGHDHGPVDPHFWLDPQRYAAVARVIGAAFIEKDPEHRSDYEAGLASVTADLDSLDRDFEQGLARCRVTDLVTSHAAFAYLSQRYGLHQVPIAGLSPEAEPDAATVRDVIDTIRAQQVPTIYSEPSASPGLTRTVAEETGVRVAVLDPVESITADSAGRDYLGVMLANLQTLRAGQECR
jgi:zinc transport system substrate-binding protein